ncbi:MAG: hypothetical protein M3N41_04400 [Acidobacteriota bacterium]|nr:hypothetical protein [Acidobacteriota bacterium]
MRTLEPQTRFLLRGSASLIGLLALWWFVLADPMLYLLKGAAAAFVEIDEHPSGDWTLRVPVDVTLKATSQKIESIDFDMARSDAITFTFSLPVLWAIFLAAPAYKVRPLVIGTLVMAAIEVSLLVAFAQCTARENASQFTGADDAIGQWMHRLGAYLTVSVLPYVAPFLVALTLHRQLRDGVFGGAAFASRPHAPSRK